MTKKIVWLVLSCLLALAMVFGSCTAAEEEEEPVVTEEEEEEEEEEEPTAPEVTPPTIEEEEEEEEVVPAGPEMVYDSQGKLVEAPQYGGTVYLSLSGGYIDHITPAKNAMGSPIKELVYEWMQQADWTKGPAGTGEHQYDGYIFGAEFMTGAVAESWEFPDEYTMIYHIRDGVHFQNKQPAWGRQYTGEDFVRILNWNWTTPWSYAYVDPATPEEDRTKVEMLDDMTVKVTFTYTSPTRPGIWDFNWQCAPETLEHVTTEGELPWENDWRYMCGTGPFILKDFVEDSAWEFERNDNYWMHDPMHPENRLPYVDRLIGLVIPDTAVYHSALQTGKLDAGILEWTKAETFKIEVPDMLWKAGGATFSRTIFPRTDVSPFTDVRVRQALTLAFNKQKMIEEYYGGNALLNGWPAQPGTEGYTPVEDMPADLQRYYLWTPQNNEDAKALLADAGYPNGFKTSVYVSWDSAEEIMLIAADDWAKINVECEVTRLDSATWSGHLWNKSSPQMIITWWENTSAAACLAAAHGGIYPPHVASFGNVIDPVAEEVLAEWNNMWSQEQAAERAAMLKQEYLREIDLCWTIYTPTPYPLLFWWPWLKNIHGISTMGRGTEVGTVIKYKYVWVDRDLKFDMVGTRD